jgi:hypothetical protein
MIILKTFEVLQIFGYFDDVFVRCDEKSPGMVEISGESCIKGNMGLLHRVVGNYLS